VRNGTWLVALLATTAIFTTVGCGAPPPPRSDSLSSSQLEATETPAPLGSFIDPPLSAGESRAEGIASTFIGDVIFGREAQARSVLTPEFNARVNNLPQALGVKGNPTTYSVAPARRVNNEIVFSTRFSYPAKTVVGSMTLSPMMGMWQITNIQPAH